MVADHIVSKAILLFSSDAFKNRHLQKFEELKGLDHGYGGYKGE